MPIYRVTVQETVTRSKEIEASTEDDARERAFEEDWRTWADDPDGFHEADIQEIVYVRD